jgi:hypothetical protein
MKALLFPVARYIGLCLYVWHTLMTLTGTQIIELRKYSINVNNESEIMRKEAVVAQVSTYFPKIWSRLKIVGASRGDMKQVPCWGPRNIRGLRTKFNRPNDLEPGCFLEGLKITMVILNQVVGSREKNIPAGHLPNSITTCNTLFSIAL